MVAGNFIVSPDTAGKVLDETTMGRREAANLGILKKALQDSVNVSNERRTAATNLASRQTNAVTAGLDPRDITAPGGLERMAQALATTRELEAQGTKAKTFQATAGGAEALRKAGEQLDKAGPIKLKELRDPNARFKPVIPTAVLASLFANQDKKGVEEVISGRTLGGRTVGLQARKRKITGSTTSKQLPSGLSLTRGGGATTGQVGGTAAAAGEAIPDAPIAPKDIQTVNDIRGSLARSQKVPPSAVVFRGDTVVNGERKFQWTINGREVITRAE
jgi:hypothetical protein